ncbi:MAG TPA: DUF711 family protein, partial [Clostridia bacterium]|nr:DUF711 family protein [Clostridia bacterium]
MPITIQPSEIMETIRMVEMENLDVRTITMGISLRDCARGDMKVSCQKIYDKIYRFAKDLVQVGESIESDYGIPIVNKRISVTPIALVGEGTEGEDFFPFAEVLDRAAKDVGVNFIGGFSALVHKGFTQGDWKLIRAIPRALAETERVCASVNIGTTKAGINMNAVLEMGRVIKETAERTADRGGLGCAKLVVFCNVPEDNPFMAGA